MDKKAVDMALLWSCVTKIADDARMLTVAKREGRGEDTIQLPCWFQIGYMKLRPCPEEECCND
jgi:hypothetical protein